MTTDKKYRIFSFGLYVFVAVVAVFWIVKFILTFWPYLLGVAAAWAIGTYASGNL